MYTADLIRLMWLNILNFSNFLNFLSGRSAREFSMEFLWSFYGVYKNPATWPRRSDVCLRVTLSVVYHFCYKSFCNFQWNFSTASPPFHLFEQVVPLQRVLELEELSYKTLPDVSSWWRDCLSSASISAPQRLPRNLIKNLITVCGWIGSMRG